MTGGTATRLPAASVLLTGEAVAAAAEAIRAAQRYRALCGMPPSAAWARLAVVLDVADLGHPDSAPGPVRHDEGMDAATAAGLLGCSERTARRLAPSLGGRKQGGVWVLDSLAVREHIDGRNPQHGP